MIESEATAALGFRRHLGFALFCAALLVAGFGPIRRLVEVSLDTDNKSASHLVLIPFVSAVLLWRTRGEIARSARFGVAAGAGVILAGLAWGLAGSRLGPQWSGLDGLALSVSPIVIVWLGGFLLFYGPAAFRLASFPLLFMLLCIPIPSVLLDGVIGALRSASAEMVALLFRVAGTPFLREGFTFTLPGMAIEVAKECSGIRSTIALFVTSLVAGYLFLGTAWKRVLLSLVVFPISIFKNAVRIVSLSLIAIHVDPRVMVGRLHEEGGIPFFLVGLGFLGIVLGFLARSERKGSGAPPRASSMDSAEAGARPASS